MSKQDIEKRLGFAAQGVKETTRFSVRAKMAKRMVVDTITSGNQKHELGYESVMQPVAAGEPPHEWFRPIVRTTNLDTGKSSEKASQPHYTEKSAREWLKNYASSVKPSTDPLYAEYASNREKISKMMTRLAQARNNPELRQKLQAESDKLDARQREVAAQLQKRKSSRPGVKTKMAASDIIVKENAQYIYYYPEDDDRATFPDDNGKGAYTVKSNRTGKPVSAKTYRSIQEAAAASNEMNEKLPPLKKAKASRLGAKAKMGFLSRVGYAATALTADPADPKSPEYRKQVSEAKAAAKDAITNYKFMRDKVKERLAALDAYVTNAIKVINSATSAKDIEHYVEQLRIAVKSQSMILGASKSPFSRPGAKAKMSATFIVSEAIFNAENAVRRGDNENARRWIKAAQDAMDETVVSTGMRSKLEQLVKRYKMSRPGAKAKA
jgi:hypothetical protein